MTRQVQYETLTNDDLLAKFLETRDKEIKRELVLRYQYIVKTIAMQLRCAYISVADMEDVIHEGIIALMDALDRFEPSKNAKFSTYAALRVRGSIIDFARKQDWAPRSVRKTAQEIDRVAGKLHIELGRTPTEQEMAQALEMDITKYRKSLADSNLYLLLSIDAMVDDARARGNADPVRLADASADVSAGLLKSELSDVLRKAIEGLKPKEQLVLSLYYRKELTMREIARVLAVSESRISQIQSASLRKLRESLEKYVREC